jgi:hypothetical protein
MAYKTQDGESDRSLVPYQTPGDLQDFCVREVPRFV